MIRPSTQFLIALVAGAISPGLCSNIQKPLVSTPPQTVPISQPLIGFGTWNLALSDENTTAAVSLAIQRGYRQIDGAAIYRNEKAVGKGIAEGLKKANITRQDLWVTSKLWNDQ